MHNDTTRIQHNYVLCTKHGRLNKSCFAGQRHLHTSRQSPKKPQQPIDGEVPSSSYWYNKRYDDEHGIVSATVFSFHCALCVYQSFFSPHTTAGARTRLYIVSTFHHHASDSQVNSSYVTRHEEATCASWLYLMPIELCLWALHGCSCSKNTTSLHPGMYYYPGK